MKSLKIKSIQKFTEDIERDVFDIDSDFSFNPITKKDKNTIVSYLQKKYNSHDAIHVAYVGNKNYYSAKSALRDIGSTFDIPPSETFAITKFYNDELSVDENIKRNDKVRQYFEKYPKVKDIFPKFIGTISNYSVHAGGVIISDKKYPLNDFCALQRTSDESVVATMFDKDELQNNLGFVKLDLLQVTALSQVAYVKYLLGEEDKLYEDYPIEENVIREVTKRGWNKNIFQFESDLGKRCFNDFAMSNIEDISNASGLIRVLGTEGGRNVYNNYKVNVSKYFAGDTEYWVKQLEKEVVEERNFEICKDVLRTTYGILIYQEQLSRLVEKFSNGKLNFSDGNQARKKLEKLIKSHGLLDNIRDQKSLKAWHTDMMDILNKYLLPYIGDSELDQDGIDFVNFKLRDGKLPVPKAGILKWFIVSGTYLFSRVHDIAYSITSYNQMYQKYYHTQQFWCSAFYCDDKKNIYKYYTSMKAESDIEMAPPNVNLSGYNFECEGEKTIRYGLSAVMGLDKAAEAIILERKKGKFESFKDFLDRCDSYRAVNKKAVENLIFANAFSDFGTPEENYKQYCEFREEEFDSSLKFNEEGNVSREFEVLGINISFKTKAMENAKNFSPISAIPNFGTRQCCVVVKKVKNKVTKNGKNYLFLQVQCMNSDSMHNLFCWTATREFKPNSMYIMNLTKKNDFISVN